MLVSCYKENVRVVIDCVAEASNLTAFLFVCRKLKDLLNASNIFVFLSP